MHLNIADSNYNAEFSMGYAQTHSNSELNLSTLGQVESGQCDPDKARQVIDLESDKCSWVFRLGRKLGNMAAALFGLASILFLLAVIANIPILQILAFGYLLEVSGRLARQEPLSRSFVGLKKATRLGSIILGSWILLWPIRLVSKFWLDAYIIDPTSTQQANLATFQVVLIVLMVAHVFCAIFCGGKLRYFFWPLVAPFSFGIWILRRCANISIFRNTLSFATGWISPRLVDDLCAVPPVTGWFLPAIVWKKLRSGRLLPEARDGLFHFIVEMHIPKYAFLGLKGFIGSAAWLLLPTILLTSATNDDGPGPALRGVLGGFLAIPVFSLLPFLQVHFAKDGNLRRFLEVRTVIRNMGRAPFAHLTALLMTLTLALPLFLLKIERIPEDLLWTLSIIFVSLTLPARWLNGWAYRRGQQGNSPSRWWIRYPVWGLLLVLSFTFVFVMFFTRYITWNGANSLIENHVFLIPAPFWFGG